MPLRSSRGAGFARLQGIWRSHGYGTLLDIGPARYRLYEETRVSCLPLFEEPLEELAEIYVDVRRSPGGQAFSARRSAGVTRIRYRRLKAVPPRCAQADPALLRDPVHNFEVFWHTFAERYALFDLRGVDWQAAHDAFRPEVDAGTGARRLFGIFVEMLKPLSDGHVELRAPFSRFNAGPPPPLQRHDLVERSRIAVRERYLQARPRRANNGLLEWGRLDDATGYLLIRSMAGHSGSIHRPRADQRAAAAALDRVMQDLGHLPSMVVDVRANNGGYDGVALRIAGYFTDRRRLAFVKAASKREGYGGRQAIVVEPRGRGRYAGRIFLLTSGMTVSAAEIFVLALMQHPRLTRIGEPTQGELSDAMERHLPNGWSLTLSNELYRASDGELYEDRGIPPHVEIPFLDRRDVEAGRDPMLDHVLGGPPESR